MVNLNQTLRPLVLVAAGVACLAAQQASHSEDQKHWGYSDEGGAIPPSAWGTLPGDALCGAGHQQSPIDLSTRSPVQSTPMPMLVYHISPLALLNNGHTVQASTDSGSTMKVGESA